MKLHKSEQFESIKSFQVQQSQSLFTDFSRSGSNQLYDKLLKAIKSAVCTGGFGTNIMEVQYVCLHPHPHPPPHPPTPLEGLVQILWTRYSMYVCTLTPHTPPHPTGGFGTNIMEVQYVCLHPHPHPTTPPPHPTGGFGTNIMKVQYVCLHPHPHPPPPHWRVWYKYYEGTVCMFAPSPPTTPLEGLVQIF